MFSLSAICALAYFIAEGRDVLAQVRTPRYYAVAHLRMADNTEALIGKLQLVQYSAGSPTTIYGVIQLSPYTSHDQFLGLHIHEYGDISEACKRVGKHYNPYGQIHGGQMDPMRHAGDLGNIAAAGQIGLINITDRQVQLVGDHTVIGRSLVLHANRDDYGRGGASSSLLDGNSGYPLACGVIGINGDFSPAAAASVLPSRVSFYFFCLALAFSLRKVQ